MPENKSDGSSVEGNIYSDHKYIYIFHLAAAAFFQENPFEKETKPKSRPKRRQLLSISGEMELRPLGPLDAPCPGETIRLS